MSESKTVKINLKQLIADLVFAFTDKNEDNINLIKQRFEKFFNLQNVIMKDNIINYLLSNNVVQDNKKLLKYFKSFPKLK
jgi:hypothetical protein